jgi:hypothetical protein
VAVDADSEVLVIALMSALEHNLSEDELQVQDRRRVVEEFLETVGKLIIALGEPGPGKVAALMYMTQSLGIASMGEAKLKVVMTLIQGMDTIHARMKAQRDGSDLPAPPPEPS